MRNISFALTTQQVRERKKWVTRRLGWLWLVEYMKTHKVGPELQPVVKGQGIPKGGKVEKIGNPIRVTGVRREPLGKIYQYEDEPAKEGFPELTSVRFVKMFCEHNKCFPETPVTRIEFEYL